MKTMTELLKQAEALGWYESDVCDDWIVLSPIKEKDNLNAAFRFFCHEGNLGGNRIAINQDWLAGFLIH